MGWRKINIKKLISNVMLVAVTVSTICGVGVPVFAADMADVSSSLSDMELLSELSEPVSVEPDASIVNAETYLSQHVDVRYAKFSQLEPVDILYVKQTFADGNLLSKEVRTIDSLWQENGVYEDAFLMQNQGYAVLYDVDASSDYYVAYANPMVSDTAFVLSDVVFAYADLDGNVLADCIYTEDGLAYVPKKYTKENRNGLGGLNVQVQFLQVSEAFEEESSISSDNPTVDVLVEVSGKAKGKVAATGVAEVNVLSPAISISLGEDKAALKSLSKSELTVFVDNVELEDDAYMYEKDTGNLVISYPASNVHQVSVEIEKKSVLDSAKDLVSSVFTPMTAQAASSSDLNYYGEEWRFGSRPSVGSMAVINTEVQYGGDSSPGSGDNGNAYIPANVTDSVLVSFINYINGGGGSVDLNNLQEGQTLTFICDIRETNTTMTDGNSVSVGLGRCYLQCAHISSPFGDQEDTSNPNQNKGKIRILEVTDEYIIFGLFSTRVTTQTGCGIFKARYVLEAGNLRVTKESGNASVTNGNSKYSLQGAVFNLSNAPGTPVYSANATTNASGVAEWTSVPVGTYVLTETSASKGYDLMSPSSVTITVNGGGWTYIDVNEPPRLGAIEVIKVPKNECMVYQNPNYSLAGAIYQLTLLNDAGNKTATVFTLPATDKNGKTLLGNLPLGTYLLEEIVVPNGYLKAEDQRVTIN